MTGHARSSSDHIHSHANHLKNWFFFSLYEDDCGSVVRELKNRMNATSCFSDVSNILRRQMHAYIRLFKYIFILENNKLFRLELDRYCICRLYF